MPYVIALPSVARGIYDSWDECSNALDGTKGERRYMEVSSREEGQAILDGRGVVLAPGSYAFTDGNGLGGVGVVLVGMADNDEQPLTVKEIPTSVHEVFRESPIPGLDSEGAIQEGLSRQKNIFAEMAALYLALTELPERAVATIVHDYVGVGDWMEGRSLAPKDPILLAVLTASLALRDEKRLELMYQHQHGHRSTWAGRHDLAHFNKRADELATQGSEARS